MYPYVFSSHYTYVQYHLFARTCVSAAGTHRCCGIPGIPVSGTVHNNSERLCTDVDLVHAVPCIVVLLVLLLRVVSKDVHVTPNLRQGLRLTQLNRMYQVYYSYSCYPPKEPLIRL